MNLLRSTVSALCFVALMVGLSLTANASLGNERTIVTFSAPVEIPGSGGAAPRVLAAGTYTFKLANTLSDRDIVRIYNKGQTHLYATVLAVPDYRLHPTGKTVIKFERRATGSPEALKAWFYPGDQYGQRFVYPKSRAVELAKMNNEAVPSISDEDAAKAATPTKTANDQSAMALKQAPIKAEKPTGQEVEVGEIVLVTRPASANSTAQNR
jgi:hypothetical protein